VRDSTLGWTRACSVWVGLSLLSSCVTRVVSNVTKTATVHPSHAHAFVHAKQLALAKLAREEFDAT